uniref:Uncharacterized protein n=1 Tax=Meloidogyne hapla TaxID=6305 RepID=A0A1I8C127_MELHA
MALLKAKTKDLINKVPPIEKIIFNECIKFNGYKSPSKYSKCLIKLIKKIKNDENLNKEKWNFGRENNNNNYNFGEIKEEEEKGLLWGTLVKF